MFSRQRLIACLAIGMLLAVNGFGGAQMRVSPYSHAGPRSAAAPMRRVNAPLLGHDIDRSKTAIFWFGRVAPDQDSVDVRVGYNDVHLFVHVGIIDRLLWYDDEMPTPEDLTDWDAVSLYLHLDEDPGSAPDSNTYRFDAQLRWYESSDNYQAGYRGNGSGWDQDSRHFWAISGWRSLNNAPNNAMDDRARMMTYYIDFYRLGLSHEPPPGTVWRLGIAVHDRDSEAGPTSHQVWPESMVSTQPDTWGELFFGTPAYEPQLAAAEGSVTVRNGLHGATVVDADVGGGRDCGASASPLFFPTWGSLNYAGDTRLNIQNLADLGDWPCISKAYITFPLDAIPDDKVIISATLTMYQTGNAGEGHNPQPSYIQVLTVDQDWDENTLTWNNAPLAVENVASTRVGVFPPQPEPKTWDVSRAVSEAYAAGTPLRLALYDSHEFFHGGKYFVSSDGIGWDEEMRPTLVVTYGRALADVAKSAAPSFGYQGDPVTYTLRLVGTGNSLTLTDTLPAEVNWLSKLTYEGTAVAPTYDVGQRSLLWSTAPPLGQDVVIRYTVGIATDKRMVLHNEVTVRGAGGSTSSAQEEVIANPVLVHLPTILR